MGDKWTLLLIRDIGVFGRHRNKDFQDAGERIPSNILASRLKRLVDQGLVEKRRYQEHPPRFEYHLTAAGQQLLSVVRAMAQWGNDNVRGAKLPPALR